MNWSWFDGKMSIEQYQHEHPLDLVAIEKSQASDQDQEPEPVAADTEEHAEKAGSQK
jgi:hypothetical protein